MITESTFLQKASMCSYVQYVAHFCTYLTVAAREAKGPGIVIARPGEDVELLCTLHIPSTTQHAIAWIINHIPHGVQSIINGILDGYSADVYYSSNLIVQNIVMNDDRNDTEYQCVILITGTTTILNRSDVTFLYVAGKYQCYVCTL